MAAPISALAYELGFEDPAYFSRYFKSRVGVTPSAFRREAIPARERIFWSRSSAIGLV